jgi:hypothetical protein
MRLVSNDLLCVPLILYAAFFVDTIFNLFVIFTATKLFIQTLSGRFGVAPNAANFKNMDDCTNQQCKLCRLIFGEADIKDGICDSCRDYYDLDEDEQENT